jgi:deoxyribodipyrimidine photo-lyase
MIQVVWFKRDLRFEDHAPLAEAARRGPVLPLYVFEPSVVSAPDFSGQHAGFARECLTELDAALRARGVPLIVRQGELPELLDRLLRKAGPFALWSHEETGNGITHARDRRVRRWCQDHAIAWTELPQHGVFRGLKDRDRWSRLWDERMTRPRVAAPGRIEAAPLALRAAAGMSFPELTESRLVDTPGRQRGGRSLGLELLSGFLDGRGQDYRRSMSSPLSAQSACSRLSAHLAYGSLSMRETVQAVWEKRSALLALPDTARPAGMLASLKAFEARLHWHCHFIQKLESEPAIEWCNMHRGFDGLRDDSPDRGRLEAWARGETGYPLVDACMRMLAHTGWINFRMRAMLVSFASYQLWMHWRDPALHLARLFLDYEPGIHYPQVQMQSGTTGINTVRIYNPVKQARDQDPDGTFVRRWVPELARVPAPWIFEPWTMSSEVQRQAGCVIGRDYPAPLVDNPEAMREARERVWLVKTRLESRDEARRVYERHGSRVPNREGRPRRRARQPEAPVQASLFSSEE